MICTIKSLIVRIREYPKNSKKWGIPSGTLGYSAKEKYV